MKQGKESKQAEIRRRLAQSTINSPEEYEEIISSLIVQRERLEGDLGMLRDKVVALQQKQAQRLAKTIKRSPKKLHLRDELSKKYEQLRRWQRRSLKAAKHPQLELQYRAYFDRLFSVEQEIQLVLRQLNDELATHKRLRKAQRAMSQQEEASGHAQEGMARENQLLKKRIFSLRKIVDRQLGKERELQNYLVDTQERQRQRERQSRERASRERLSRQRRDREEEGHRERQQRERKRVTSQSSHRSNQSSDSEIVDFEVRPQHLATREEVYQIEGRLNRIEKRLRTATAEIEKRFQRDYPNEALKQKREGSKLSFGKEFDLLLDRVKTSLNLFNELSKQKVKLLLLAVDRDENRPTSEDRSDRSSDSSLLRALKPADAYKRTVKARNDSERGHSPFHRASRVKSSSSSPCREKVMYAKARGDPVAASTQTDSVEFYGQMQLRRDFIGCIDQHASYDRSFLQKASSSIKSLEVYYTDRGIASVRAIYTVHSSGGTAQGPLALPESFVKNYCKVHVIDTSHDDFIRYFKLRFHSREGRVTSVKVVSNRGVKGGWSDSKTREVEVEEEVEKELVLDINEDEYPTAIFCSHLQRGPYWYLAGFGVEIDLL